MRTATAVFVSVASVILASTICWKPLRLSRPVSGSRSAWLSRSAAVWRMRYTAKMGIAEAATSHQEDMAAVARMGAIATWVARRAHSLLNHWQKGPSHPSPVRRLARSATSAKLVSVQAAPAAKMASSCSAVPLQIAPSATAFHTNQATTSATPCWEALKTVRHAEALSCSISMPMAAVWTTSAGRKPQVIMVART
jgi:hypothetical protein